MPLRGPNVHFFFSVQIHAGIFCVQSRFNIDIPKWPCKEQFQQAFQNKTKSCFVVTRPQSFFEQFLRKIDLQNVIYYLYLYKNEKCRSLTYLYEICKHYLIWYENSFKNLKSSLSNFRIQCSKENSILNIRAHAQVQQFQLVHRKLWNTSFVMLVSIQHFYIGNTGIQNF